jgi:hypothetical protein
MSDLDRCPVCSSVHLVRRLGEAECRDCGSVRPSASMPLPGHLAALASGAGSPAASAAGPGAAAAAGADGTGEAAAVHGLAQEVELALARVLGRTAGSAAGG